MKPRRVDAATRLSLGIWTRLCDWRSCVSVVRPQTVIRWHRSGWRQFWRFKSRPGRATIPADLRLLIRRMASENPTWGQERIANELLLKLEIRISPRTFRQIYVFVVMHHSSRRLLYFNVTNNPSADWTLQQLRQTFGTDEAFLYLLHDRDSIFSEGLDRSMAAFDPRVLKSPPRSPKANAICERLIGTIRRECLWRRCPFDSIFAHHAGALAHKHPFQSQYALSSVSTKRGKGQSTTHHHVCGCGRTRE